VRPQKEWELRCEQERNQREDRDARRRRWEEEQREVLQDWERDDSDFRDAMIQRTREAELSIRMEERTRKERENENRTIAEDMRMESELEKLEKRKEEAQSDPMDKYTSLSINELKKVVAQLEAQIEDTRRGVRKTLTADSEFQESLVRAEKQLSQHNAVVESLEDELDTLELEDKKALDGRLEEITAKLEEEEEKVDVLVNSKKGIREEMDALDIERESLKKQVDVRAEDLCMARLAQSRLIKENQALLSKLKAVDDLMVTYETSKRKLVVASRVAVFTFLPLPHHNSNTHSLLLG